MKIFNKYPFLIAEIGVNFYDIAEKEEISNMEAAKLMILEAKKCGVDAVKFQSWSSGSLYSKDYYKENPISKRFFDKFSFD